MKRDEMLAKTVTRREPWDVVVIGGGATGAGIALDAAARGFEVLLLEQHDFGKGTSSRSTKLVHGGVRYLAQGNLHLVREALRERGLLRQNAAHLVRDLAFLVPGYAWWELPWFGLGLKAYDLLAGRLSLGHTRWIGRAAALERAPTLEPHGLRGAVLYHDGQFDDARLLIDLLFTAASRGATLLNYARVTALLREANGAVRGVRARDAESGQEFEARGRVVINATGVFCDEVRHLAGPGTRLVAPSQGSHLVLDRSFLPGDTAIMVPRTPDGRVMFAIPWHEHTLVGTTDVERSDAPLEPRPSAAEIDFLLEVAGKYLARRPERGDILSMFAGIRPLVRAGQERTAALSREHLIVIEPAGLVTITGGKWTTYRSMAEECVDRAAEHAGLPCRPCPTADLRLVSAEAVEAAERLHRSLSYTAADVVRAARSEMARTVEDVLARRTRALFLDARAALEMAPRVAELLGAELGWDVARQEREVEAFEATARGYFPSR
jgi:glycerol-3-phosphate dehydrogenase